VTAAVLPLPLRFAVRRRSGPATITVLAIAWAWLWIADRPAQVPWGTFLGQLVGAQSVFLMTVALVLISTVPWVETWFDGIDRAAIWHRRLAITGLLLLLPHLALSSNHDHAPIGPALGATGALGLTALAVWSVLPRWRSVLPRQVRGMAEALTRTPPARVLDRLIGGYDRWRLVHRLTGLFVAAGFAHGALDATAFGGSALLRGSYLAVGGVGVAFYAYRELLARRFAPMHDFQVAKVTPVGPGLTEIELRPLGRRFTFIPGQFAMVFLEAKDGWHRHPFTIASAPGEGVVRVTVKALGDWTAGVAELVEPGMPAVIGGPHGRFTHRKGGPHQVWVAGGVGVTPFLSWLRSIQEHPVQAEVDFFYASSQDPVPYAAEIQTLADRHGLRAHVVRSEVDGRLTPDLVLSQVAVAPPQLSVFLCGPEGLVQAMSTGLRAAGVRSGHIHREYFTWR
jgi:predicted ferric reductase